MKYVQKIGASFARARSQSPKTSNASRNAAPASSSDSLGRDYRRNNHSPKARNASNDERSQSPPASGGRSGRRPVFSDDTASSKPETLTMQSAVEEFLEARLIKLPASAPCAVSSDETVGRAAGLLHERRLGSCIVNFPHGPEFLDCCDFSASIVELLGACRSSDWSSVKSVMNTLAQQPVSRLLKFPRREAFTFRHFDASYSLSLLLVRLKKQLRIPVFRKGELCVILTPNDILELCSNLSKSATTLLVNTPLAGIVEAHLAAHVATPFETTDETSTLDIMKHLHAREARVVSIISHDNDASAGANDNFNVVGHFDLAALWVLFASRSDGSASWWWEDAQYKSNILLESSMDFIALGPTGADSNIAGDLKAPVAKVSMQDSVSRALIRSCSSHFRRVVVYVETKDGGDRSACRRPCCDLSAHDLVLALVDAGLFEQLSFDPSKPKKGLNKVRRAYSEFDQQEQQSLTKTNGKTNGILASTKSPDVRSSHSNNRVSFSDAVEYNDLQVPVCPEHYHQFMKYENAKRKLLSDYQHLGESNSEDLIGCCASCMHCEKELGAIVARSREIRTSTKKCALKKPSKAVNGGGKNIHRQASHGASKAINGGGSQSTLHGHSPVSERSAHGNTAASFRRDSDYMFGFCCVSNCNMAQSTKI